MELEKDVQNLCRLCALSLDESQAQDENDLFQINNIYIHQQIKELAGFMIENEPELPRYFCVNCKNNLLQAHTFRCSLIEVHKFFKKKYKERLHKNASEGTNNANTFDAVFISENADDDPIDKETIENNSVSEDFCETTVEILNDFELKEELLTQEDDKKKTGNKKFRKYKKTKKEKKPDVESVGDVFICEQCGMSFKTMKFLEIHSVRHEEKKFECDVCSAKFFLPTELKRHKVSHTGEKPASCRFCNTKFLNKSNRNRHEKSQHLKLRPYPCELCGKAFANTHLRKNHMVVHTKERAFDCKLCQKSFLRKNHLVTHYKSTAHKKNEIDNGNVDLQSFQLMNIC